MVADIRAVNQMLLRKDYDKRATGRSASLIYYLTGLKVARDLKLEDRLHAEVAILDEKHRGTVAPAIIYGTMVYCPAIRRVEDLQVHRQPEHIFMLYKYPAVGRTFIVTPNFGKAKIGLHMIVFYAQAPCPVAAWNIISQ